MENVNALIKTVIVISFMWSIAESTLPQSDLNKYTEFVYGLIIMSVIVSAIVNVDSRDFFPDFEGAYNSYEYTDGYLKGLYEEKLEQILIEKFDDEDIDVELDDEYKISNIFCENIETYEKIMGYLNE